ncbi:AfsR/SARP family transcriptional regulator [Streptomyces sp. MNU77]|uniref:AfsR/SARP family transcriptional regulator n=1 Tax=Streptomyces sp. MNU77 TaxID=1573406 RepID=UPI0007C87925|nr:BTAD domain-containing putative transcriptional regulator [Streptomyces sp. MNU77]OLO30845.1 AfsR/SARP family transcriptional regulator [Streptomyces sp. MNU77]
MQAWRGEQPMALGSPQQRAVLALLLLKQGRPASVDELVDAVWGQEPPPGAVSVLRTYVSRLRAVLEPGRSKNRPSGVLVSVAGGYALHAPEGTLDLTVFESRVHEAKRLRARGDHQGARELLRRALDAWNGAPLAGVPGAFAEAERTRLAELRLGATETRVELDVELGGHSDAVPELIALATAHPLRERLRLLLMLSLYRSDRQAEALAVYHDTRRTLIAELGIEPGPAVRDLHRRLLAADPALAAPDRAAEPLGSAVRPAQLPGDLSDFTGREAETARVTAALSGAAGTAVPVAVLTGMGGAGKTVLAVHAAHAVSGRFPDGQLYVDLRGADGSSADPSAVLAGFLRALGEKDQGIPDSPEERAALYRSVLAGRRVLVVLDNARDAEQVRPLLPGSGGCAAVVTSRSALAALSGATRVVVDVFRPQVAAALFTRILGGPRTEHERLAILRVADLCGGHPLAVRIVASRLAVRPDWTVTDTVDQLKDERQRIGELRIQGLAVEACFRLGYGELDPEQARAFRLLSLPAPGPLTLVEAAAVLGRPQEVAEPLLESLVDVGMLESPARRRYRFHDLLRLFARHRAQEEESADARQGALTGLLDLLLATARNAYGLLRPGHRVPLSLLPTEHPGVRFADEGEACAWGAGRLSPALEFVAQIAPADPAGAADLVLALDPLFMVEHRWSELIPVARAVVAAARRAGDRRAERRICYMLGGALMQVEELQSAHVVTSVAMELSEGTEDHTVHAMVLNVAGLLAAKRGVEGGGLDLGLRAVAEARVAQDRSVEALALGNVILECVRLGQVDELLLDTALRQLDLYETLGDHHGRAYAHYRIGQVLRGLGRPAEALSQFEECLERLGPNGHLFVRCAALIRCAGAYLSLGEPQSAARYAERAIALAREMNFERGEAHATQTLGDALDLVGHVAWARACWERSLAVCLRLGMADEAAYIRGRLGPPPALPDPVDPCRPSS